MSRQKKSRRPMSEINVVPYIDVMLVLLVIFMITAPLLTQGVKVDLPQADSEPLPAEMDDTPVDSETLVTRIAAVLAYKPKTPIMVKGDRNVDYGQVVRAMVLIQQAGAPNVGLITETPER